MGLFVSNVVKKVAVWAEQWMATERINARGSYFLYRVYLR
jgi:hypothetical protein